MAYNYSIPGQLFQRTFNASTGKWTTGLISSMSLSASDNKPDTPARGVKPSGWLYPKPYSRLITSVNYPKGSWRSTDKNGNILEYSGNIGGYHVGFDLPSTPTRDDLRVRAEIDALSKLKSQKINLSVAMGEIQSTANMFGSACRDLASMTRSLRKGRAWKDIKRATRNGRLSQEWLRYVYGVRPFISDVNGALSELSERDSLIPTVAVKGRAVEQINAQRWQQAGTSSFPLLITDTGLVGCFVRLDYECTNNLLSSAGRLGLTNPFETAWELLPYSFVLDWALPIGDWLHTIDAAIGFTFKSGSCSLLYRIQSKGVGDSRNYGGHWPNPTLNYSGSGRTMSLRRTVYNGSPIPRLIGPKNPLSLSHVASGLSLLVQAFK